jgi:uncharacterized protein (TIGR01777 family)
MARVLITGATGFIGPKLVRRLRAGGAGVSAYVRDADRARAVLGPDVELLTDLGAVPPDETVDAIVNLAGASIAGGVWTARRRRVLLESRLGVTRELLELCARLEKKPETWINASAIGYYGARVGDEPLDERAVGGLGFQAELCRRWEEAAAQAAAHGVHVSALRFGVVLGNDGGALPQFALPLRLYAGTVLGSGRQWFSWIHVEDLLELVLFVLGRRTLTGALNATAPEPVRAEAFMRALASALRRPLWPVRIPAPIVRGALGELAELFVDGQRVVPARALALGFRFAHPEIESALRQLLVPADDTTRRA